MGRVLDARAYVNHGRWVADCPRCNGGVLPESQDKCHDCGADLLFQIPDKPTRDEAERVLARRPTENRNWYPEREDIEDLRAENALHGLEF